MRLEQPFEESIREKRASCTWRSSWVRRIGKWRWATGYAARSRYTVAAGDTAALLECIAKAKARCALAPEARVHSCYEAGRDGFWLHRWLVEQGIDDVVVDSASIEVNRRARRAKTDRLDAGQVALDVEFATTRRSLEYGRWCGCPPEQKTRGGRTGNWGDWGTSAPLTAIGFVRCWC